MTLKFRCGCHREREHFTAETTKSFARRIVRSWPVIVVRVIFLTPVVKHQHDPRIRPHGKVRCLPDVSCNRPFFNLKIRTRLYYREEPFDSHWTDDMRFNFYPLKRLLIDP